MTKTSIEDEIVMIVKDIRELEEGIKHMNEILKWCSKYTVELHTNELHLLEQALKRKMQLLAILKS